MEYAFGLEEHRQFFKKLIIRDHQLDENISFEVGCFMNSTRLLMFDLGRLIIKEFQEKNEERKPIVCKFINNLILIVKYHLNLVGIILEFIKVFK